MTTEEEALLQFFTATPPTKKPLHVIEADIQSLITSLEQEIQLSKELQKTN